ncbi:hypothetical protein [Asticcacaulis sp. AND118]|uniref:hypothetical protein n=1 Tax=Asticcacaulis sp. AND118 TaxID=2840468 RepID=UPI001CFFCC16|nr:hypothetical protein [Asticcacaulis sp. AND118]UDF02523.1 hypothetical protein LH365_08735 [Asticcacaulis sp. AND118]
MRLVPLLTPTLLVFALTACKPVAVTEEDRSYATSESVAAVDVSEAPLAYAEPSLNPTRASTATCLEEKGQIEADKLAKRCRAVSPATHPPCHVNNPCLMIQGEIERSCAMYGPDEKKPTECAG